MIKTAIIVEGFTELGFVRELLLKLFEYKNIDLECYNLLTKSDFTAESADYPFPNPEAEYHFQLINVGNDSKVLPRILNREPYLYKQGYSLIIGLRDMYSEEYQQKYSKKHQEQAKRRKVDSTLNKRFIEGTNKTIQDRTEKFLSINFHFAIMEVEAWLLGFLKLKETFKKHNLATLDIAKVGFDLDVIDLEKDCFHPLKNLKNLLVELNIDYKKGDNSVNSIMSEISSSDITGLRKSNLCPSFSVFYDNIPKPDSLQKN